MGNQVRYMVINQNEILTACTKEELFTVYSAVGFLLAGNLQTASVRAYCDPMKVIQSQTLYLIAKRIADNQNKDK